MTEKNRIDVSIVIITWRMRNLLETMLDSLIYHSKEFSYELIIIDNNSQDGTIELIESKYTEAILIKNSENKGVAPARNQGLKIARGRYILILDADMELVENSIKRMLDYMDSDTTVGLSGCKLLDTNRNLQMSCKNFPSIFSLLARRLEFIPIVKKSKVLAHHVMSDWDHKQIREVDYVIGACQFFRSELLSAVGPYDENIFYGPEDLDFCLRAWRKGFKVTYFPETHIIHHEQRITKKNIFSAISRRHFKGIYYIFKKYNFHLTR